MHVWIFPERGCTVIVPPEVLEVMTKMARAASPDETGGTLVGHYSSDMREAFVEQALGVRTGARSSRTAFYRPPDSDDGQLAEIYHASSGLTHYLGEWHTHPNAGPNPSRKDLATLRGLARSASVATDTPILIILGDSFISAPPGVCVVGESSGRCLYGHYEGSHAPSATRVRNRKT